MENFYTREEMAQILGIGVPALMNRISKGKNHPPCFGRGSATRFPKNEFARWSKERLIYEVAKAS